MLRERRNITLEIYVTLEEKKQHLISIAHSPYLKHCCKCHTAKKIQLLYFNNRGLPQNLFHCCDDFIVTLLLWLYRCDSIVMTLSLWLHDSCLLLRVSLLFELLNLFKRFLPLEPSPGEARLWTYANITLPVSNESVWLISAKSVR